VRVRERRWRDQDGSGSVSAVFGVAVFLSFLLVASQVLLHLYTTSTITAAAFDAARRAAAADGGGCGHAPARARALLGAYGERPEVRIDCIETDQRLQVTVVGPSPARGAARAFGRLTNLDVIERAATVRRELPG
jgi:hypothetical protein